MAENNNDTVPYSRFREVNEAKNKLEQQLADTKAQLEKVESTFTERVKALESEHAEKLKGIQTERDELVSTLESERLDHQIDRTIRSAGISEDGVDYLRFKYSQAKPEPGEDGEDAKPPSFEDWFKSYAEQNKTQLEAFKAAAKAAQQEGDEGGDDDSQQARSPYSWQKVDTAQTETTRRTPVKTVPDDKADPPNYTPEQIAGMNSKDARGVLERIGLVQPRPKPER